MRYELGSFPVEDVVFGPRTRWHDGILELDRDELLGLVLQEHQITAARVELAKPGEPVRIINTDDVVDTKVKVSGGGTYISGPLREVHRCGGSGPYPPDRRRRGEALPGRCEVSADGRGGEIAVPYPPRPRSPLPRHERPGRGDLAVQRLRRDGGPPRPGRPGADDPDLHRRSPCRRPYRRDGQGPRSAGAGGLRPHSQT